MLQLDGSSIRVAEYLTELPARDALRACLHQAIELARQRAAPPMLPYSTPEAEAPPVTPKPRRKKKGDVA